MSKTAVTLLGFNAHEARAGHDDVGPVTSVKRTVDSAVALQAAIPGSGVLSRYLHHAAATQRQHSGRRALQT